MTATEYGIQYLQDDGDWQFSIAGDAEQMGTPTGALNALDRARGMFPGDVWRIVYRTIPAWATAHEAALREDAAAEGHLMAEPTTRDLDRCPHGRHIGDTCAGWQGPGPFDGGCQCGYSLGNPYADGRLGRIGTTVSGEPIAAGDLPEWRLGDA